MGESVEKMSDDSWKESLISQMIIAMAESRDNQEEVCSEIGQCYFTQAPARLFKYYRGTAQNIQNIESGKMWFSAPCNFNDVFDCRIAVDRQAVFDAAINAAPVPIKKGSRAWLDIQTGTRKETKKLEKRFDDLRRSIGVACFSETYDSVLMWSHYGDRHHGFCAEYGLLDINKQLNYTPAPVVYSTDSVVLSNFSETEINAVAASVFVRSLFTKAKEWNYEREWRIIQDQSACGSRWNDESKGALLDMITPTSLILGCEAEPWLAERIKRYCENNKVNLYKMEKDPVRFSLVLTSLLNFDGSTLSQY